MLLTPYPSQQLGIDDALTWVKTAKAGDKRLYAAPTGYGKSVMILKLLEALPDWWLVTPRVEIIAGMLEKMGHDISIIPEAELLRVAWFYRITTPTRLQNKMLKGEFSENVAGFIFDEGHHHAARTWQNLDALAGRAPALGFTATPYRGTPRSTQDFLAQWGEPVWVITYPEAVEQGYISMPTCSIVPLVDDDELAISNGEFEVSTVAKAVSSRLQDAVELVARTCNWSNAHFDRPTMCSLPTREVSRQFVEMLNATGVPAVAVDADTPAAARRQAFEDTVACHVVLVQISVVSEGVDLPIRRLIDLSPVVSPVKWLQQFGRITRPVKAGEAPPVYIATNRNLLRHAYLLDGCLPSQTVKEAQAAFPPSTRQSLRVLGLEALGRLKPIEVEAVDGTRLSCFCFSANDGAKVQEYAVIVHPAREEALWASRQNHAKGDGTRAYGRWQKCDAPRDLTGYASLPNSALSEKQAAWWKRDARRYGLNPDAKVTRKNFAVLPVLADTRSKL